MPCVCLEDGAHCLRGVMHAGFHCPSRYAEDFADLGRGQADVVGKDQHRAMFEAETIEGVPDLVLVRDIDREIRLEGLGDHRDRSAEAAATSVLVSRRVDQEPMEPRIESPRISEPRQLFPTVDERVLHRIFGKVSITKDESSGCVETVENPVHEEIERITVTAPGPLDDLDRSHGLHGPPERTATHQSDACGAALVQESPRLANIEPSCTSRRREFTQRPRRLDRPGG